VLRRGGPAHDVAYAPRQLELAGTVDHPSGTAASVFLTKLLHLYVLGFLVGCRDRLLSLGEGIVGRGFVDRLDVGMMRICSRRFRLFFLFIVPDMKYTSDLLLCIRCSFTFDSLRCHVEGSKKAIAFRMCRLLVHLSRMRSVDHVLCVGHGYLTFETDSKFETHLNTLGFGRMVSKNEEYYTRYSVNTSA
jgi:hypothetical protein